MTVSEASVELDQEDRPAASGRPLLFGRFDLGIPDLALGVAAVALLAAYAPGLNRASPVLLPLVAWPLGAVGIVGLAVLVRRGDVAARWAAAYLAWAALATAFSAQPRLSLYGGYATDRGWVFLAAYVGCWAVGRRRGATAAPAVIAGLLLGLALNVLLAVRQATVDGVGLLALYADRAMGFPLNPVFLGALMSGGLAMVGALMARAGARWWGWALATFGFALAANLSGSRIAVVTAGILGIAAVWRGGRGRTMVYVVALALGAVVGSAMLPSAGTSRVAPDGQAGSMAARTEMWQAGLSAAAEEPLVGWGPNRFRPATSARTNLEFVRAEGVEKLYFDAHNIAVEQLVTVGLPGLVLAGGFAVAVARRARGPLAWYGLGVAVTWLLQPAAVSTVPAAMLALGLASGGPDPDPPLGRPDLRLISRLAAAVLALGAFALAARTVYVDRLVYQANENGLRGSEIGRAVDLLPRDPSIMDLRTQELARYALDDPTPAARAAVVASAQQAVELDPTFSRLWNNLGRAHLVFGPPGPAGWAQARAAHEEALRQSPWSTVALEGLYQIALWEHRTDDARDLYVALCTVDQCPHGEVPPMLRP